MIKKWKNEQASFSRPVNFIGTFTHSQSMETTQDYAAQIHTVMFM